MGATPVSERRRYDLYDGDTWYGVKHMTDAGVAVMQRHGYRVTAVAEEGEAQPDVELTSAAVQKALADPIDVPHECICAYIRVMPYGLVQRHANPDCTEHSPDEPDGELEKERD